MQEVGTSSIAPLSPRVMDERTRERLAQAIRDALTSSDIDHNEDYIDSLVSQVDDDVLQAHLASQGNYRGDTPLRTSGSALQTPPASPARGRGSNRISNAQKREYANLAGAEPRKKKKKQIRQCPDKCGNEPSPGRIADGTIETGSRNIDQPPLPNDDHRNETQPSKLPIDTSSSYHPDSAYTTKAMASILFECFNVNSAIARYGRRVAMVPVRTDPVEIRKYADEVAGYSYEQAISAIHRDSAMAMGKGVQNRYYETIFWKIILKGAALIDRSSLPSAKGPTDGFTMAEKAATKRFMEDAGHRLGAENQRQYRIFWRNLLKMREAGIEKALYYRTKEFDSYCKGYPKTSETSLVDTIKKWEAQYGPHIEQLETRLLRLGKGDWARVSDLDNPQVTERLKVPESCWNCTRNEWAFPNEEESYKGIGLQTFSPDMVCAPYDDQLVSETGGDKSAFIFLLPKDDSSLLVCSIVPVREGDFLGVFAGKIRFSESWSLTHGIRGPVDDLWLDYSQVTGTLNQMLVSEPGGSANVRIHWELTYDDVDPENCAQWRVSVKATKFIMPFEPLVREAAQQEQYVWHSSPEHAKRGFLEICETD
ncbi:hypothetical protein ACMYSQ_012470 [Aspergillus niger]